jgi:cell division protein FtsB
MATEQQTQQNKEHKCGCNKQLADLKKEVAELKKEIELLRLVLRSVK